MKKLISFLIVLFILGSIGSAAADGDWGAGEWGAGEWGVGYITPPAAEVPSPSGGGGGGGGVSNIISHNIALTEKGTIQRIEVGEFVSFKYGNIYHTITLQHIKNGKANIAVTSPLEIFNLGLSERALADINSDGIKEVRIIVLGLTDNSATLGIEKVISGGGSGGGSMQIIPVKKDAVKPTAEAAKTEEVKQEPIKEAEPSVKGISFTSFVIAMIILIAVAVISFCYLHYKDKKDKKKTGSSKQE